MRGTHVKIGATKEDFAANLDAAIDADECTRGLAYALFWMLAPFSWLRRQLDP